MRPPSRRDLKNKYGAKATTTVPVPATKPDLRKYPKPRREPAPPETTPAERREFRSRLRTHRPHETKWRLNNGGVCDQVGDVVTATLPCEHCGAWFSVQRSPASVRGRWPQYCTEDCREIHQAIRQRKQSRKVRSGGTSGAKKPRYTTFEPETMTVLAAHEYAETLVNGPPDGRWDRWATPKALDLAAAHLEDYDRESESYASDQ